MADIQITVDAGTQTRLLTSEKYCKDDILVTAGSGTVTNNWHDIIDGNTAEFFDESSTRMTNYVFQDSKIITSASMTKVKSAGASCFQSCKNLERLYLPNIKTIGNLFAYQSGKLKWVYMGQVENLTQFAFNECEAISALVLGLNQVLSLADANTFVRSGIASGTGYIYVPDDLVDQYKVATNWATYASQIKGLSEIPAEVQEWLDQQGGAS